MGRVMLLSGGAIGVLLVGMTLFSPLFHVREVRIIRATPRLDIEHVQTLLTPLFGTSMFSLSLHEVRVLLEEYFTDIETVDMQKEYPGALIVHIALEPLLARLILGSDTHLSLPSSGSGVALREYLTVRGRYVVSRGEGVQETIPLIRVVDWGARPVDGVVLLSPANLAVIFQAEKALLEQFGQEVQGRTIFLRAHEFHLDTGTEALWFSMESPLPEQLRRYQRFLETVRGKEAEQYIDLRLSDRVTYR